ncbi:MAG: sodium:solute symporter family protein [Chthonomonadales bacterium]|nr:sodium:solute symporter family protein [Chthonomonadales bacterium]
MIRAHLAGADAAILVGYLAFTVLVGFWRRRRGTQAYLIANRSLRIPVFVATLVATWYGGILGVGEMTYRYGLVNWTTQGLPYYLFAVLFALVLARRVRSSALYTIPDKLAAEHGRPTALLGAAFAFLMVTPAPYVLMTGQLVSALTGLALLPALVAGTLFSVAYVYVGGFQADVRINVLQFVLMFAGFLVALPCVVAQTGGTAWLAAHLPPDHLRLDGGLGLPYVLVWFLIALWTLVDPGFHQRCYAARTPAVARAGILAAVCCWFVFDALTTSAGLYARAGIPDLAPALAGMAYPALAERFLPAGVKGLFYVAMLATVMSTVASYTFLAAMTVGRDLVWRLRCETGDERVPLYTRWGLVTTSLVAILISLYVPSVVRQWWAIGTVFVPGMILSVLTAYAPRWKAGPAATFLAMGLGASVSAACLAFGWARHGLAADVSDSALFPFGVQPMYPGLAAALLVHAAGLAAERLRRSRACPS